MKKVLQQIRQELKRSIDLEYKKGSEKFFKEGVRLYGVRSAVTKKIEASYFKEIKHLNKEEVFELCEELLESDFMEEAMVALDWSHRLSSKYEEEDFARLEKWLIKYVNNWAKCDTLCNHSIGDFLMKYPKFISKAKTWTKSKKRWVRRGSAVSLIIPARRGLFLKEIFQIADSLILDKDDLVQKGYGWMLKAASEARQKEVFDYVMKNKDRMPRTALRYAIEKMPARLKKQAMAK